MTKTIPANVEAEEAILGCLIFDSDSLAKIKDTLMAKAFFIPANQKIYQAIVNVYETDKKTDYISLVDYLQSRNLLEECGGTARLAKLLNQTVSSLNIDRYAKLVNDKYTRRKIIALGHEIVELGYSPHESLDAINERIRELLPSDILEEKPLHIFPTVTEVEYQTSNPDNPTETIKLKANVEKCPVFEDAIADLKSRTDTMANHLWNKTKKNHPPSIRE